MPDDLDDTTPAPYVLPFEVPADLTAADDDTLRGLLSAISDHAAGFATLSPAETTDDTITALRACRDLAVSVNGELTGRTAQAEAEAARAAQAAEFAAEVTAATTTAPAPPAPPTPPARDSSAPADADTTDTTAVTAARRATPPSVRDTSRAAGTPSLPADAAAPRYATMTASADVPGFITGQELGTFADVGRAIDAQMHRYPTVTTNRASRRAMGADTRRPVDVYDPANPSRRLAMSQFTRHNVVQFRRQFPDDLTYREGGDAYSIAQHAADERRLPGGSLVASAQQVVNAGQALTAAAGWCAPSTTIYQLCELETMDGLLDVPEMQADRGGFMIPQDGGPDFASIWDGVGDSGDTHLTEANVIADTEKVCYEIPCPEFDDVRLGVDYVCLTAGLLQRRGWPEVIARFGRGAIVALAHKINRGLISGIVTASGAATVIPADPSGDDAISGILSAVDLAIADAKYRNRMTFGSTLEVVLPMWVLVQMRAAASRRSGVDMVGVTDAQIMGWFAQRNAVPRFVYDWQDQFSGLGTGPGGSTALTALPTTVQFLVYPAGTWVKAVQPVVNLDTVYDSTLLATNQYTALFVEDGWAPLQMCPTSRLYTAPVDPSGVVACCTPGS